MSVTYFFTLFHFTKMVWLSLKPMRKQKMRGRTGERMKDGRTETHRGTEGGGDGKPGKALHKIILGN